MTFRPWILLLCALPVAAQAPAKPAQPAAPPPIEDVALIQATPYKPTIQRDPFSTPRDERPADAGDTIDDISVKGLIRREGRTLAIISDSRGNVRWLAVGHRFKDGEIVAIGDKGVTFRQWDIHTTNRTVFRTITKSYKREEGKR